MDVQTRMTFWPTQCRLPLRDKETSLKVIEGLANGSKAINEDSNPGNLML